MSNHQISSPENGSVFYGYIPLEGTAARTRPFSLEEALLRRKNRLTGSNLECSSNDPDTTTENKDQNGGSDMADLPDKYEKDIEDIQIGISGKKEIVQSEKEEEHLKRKWKNKTDHELEGNAAVKAFDSNAKHQSRDKNESSSHQRSRTKDKFKVEPEKEVTKKHAKGIFEGDKQGNKHKIEDRYKSESERGTSKKRSKHVVEDSGYDKSRKELQLKSDIEKESSKKRSKLDDSKDKDDHRSRFKDQFKDGHGKENVNKRHKDVSSKEKDDRRIRDDDRYKGRFEYDDVKQRSKFYVVKDRDMLWDRSPPRNDRRLYHGHDAKFKSDFERSSFRRCDSHRVEFEDYSDRKHRRYEETITKRRRRSRSRTPDYVRERSVSVSPRVRRHHRYGKDYAETLSLNSKERSSRKHLEVDKYRTSGSSEYEGGHNQPHSSGLGGYSPRKRKTEPITESPPVIRSPDRKSTMDQPSADSIVTSQPIAVGAPDQPSSGAVNSTFKKAQATLSPSGAATVLDTSLDYVQLTQATRPMRRLYVENLPTSVSDKDVIEWLNGVLLSSGANHIPGSSPCISCIINKERSQAVAEFLTPEDATAALAFDGRSFCGSALKIRRPKDFPDTTSAILEKPVAIKQTVVTETSHSVSDIVENSPNKIFVGGISKLLSADMFMEIANAFGVLKSYHLETSEIEEPCAFLEYLDPSITHKACSGLNGMKLGGCILTAVLAFPNYHLKQELAHAIPDHAKPLLQNPTKVLRLKYVFNPEDFVLLSESELEETVEDVRLECSRFGTVKSINIVKDNWCSDGNTVSSEQNVKVEYEEMLNGNEPSETELMPCHLDTTARFPVACENVSADNDKQKADPEVEAVPLFLAEDDANIGVQPDLSVPEVSPPEFGKTHPEEEARFEHEGGLEPTEGNGKVETEGLFNEQNVTMEKLEPNIDVALPQTLDDKKHDDLKQHWTLDDQKLEDVKPELHNDETEQNLGNDVNCNAMGMHKQDQEEVNTSGLERNIGEEDSKQVLNVHDDSKLGGNHNKQLRLEEYTDNAEIKQEQHYDNVIVDNELMPELMEEDGNPQINNTDVFEIGCILVEFLREEAACTAAHSLNGRLYDNRTVEAGYVPYNHYIARFLR